MIEQCHALTNYIFLQNTLTDHISRKKLRIKVLCLFIKTIYHHEIFEKVSSHV